MPTRPGPVTTNAALRGRPSWPAASAAVGIVILIGSCSLAWGESGYFIHISDPHVTVVTYHRWRQQMEQILATSPHPDLVLCTGDLVDFGAGIGGNANYNALLSPPITSSGDDHWIGDGVDRIPIFFAPGNHDYRNLDHRTEDLANYKLKVHSATYFHRLVGSYAIFSVNSGYDTLTTGTPTLPEGTGLFDTAASPDVANLIHDLDMLDGVLNGYDTSGYKKIVFMHHPHQYPDREQQLCMLDGAFVRKSSSFVQACQNYGVGWVLFGHLHPDQSLVYDLGCGVWTGGETKCVVAVAATTGGYHQETISGVGLDVVFASVPAPTRWGLLFLGLLALAAGGYQLRRVRTAA